MTLTQSRYILTDWTFLPSLLGFAILTLRGKTNFGPTGQASGLASFLCREICSIKRSIPSFPVFMHTIESHMSTDLRTWRGGGSAVCLNILYDFYTVVSSVALKASLASFPQSPTFPPV